MIDTARHALRSGLRCLVQGVTCHPQHLEFEICDQKIGMLDGLVVTLRVHLGDYGRVLGKNGANFEALRIVAETIGARCATPVKLAPLLSSVVGECDRYKFSPNCNWPGGMPLIKSSAESAAKCLFGDDSPLATFDVLDERAFRTRLMLRVKMSPKRAAHAAPIMDALARLIDAAGRKHGRIIETELDAQIIEDERQPKTADGRFTKAEER